MQQVGVWIASSSGGKMRGPGVVFCGNLPSDVKEKEVDDLFYKARRLWRRAMPSQPPDCRIAGTWD